LTERLPTSVEAFAEGPATREAATRLAAVPEPDLLQAIDALAEAGQRAHLEAMGDAPLVRAVRKAARKAAYRLKSAGLGEERGPLKATLGAPDDGRISLEALAIATPPGLTGFWFLLLGSFADAPTVEIRGEPQGGIAHIEVHAPIAVKALARLVGDVGQGVVGGPFLCHADLAVRLIDTLAEEVRARGGRFAQEWTFVAAWRATAVAHGADPGRVDARRARAGELATMPAELGASSADVLAVEASGTHLPPAEVLSALMKDAMEAARGRAGMTEAAWGARLDELVGDGLDRWLGDADARARAARALDATADVLHARSHPREATQALWVADQLRAGARPRDIPFLLEATRRVVDNEAAQPMSAPTTQGSRPG